MASDDGILARRIDVVVISQPAYIMPPASIQIVWFIAIGIGAGANWISVHRDADARRMAVFLRHFDQAVSHRVQMIAYVQVNMTATIVKRRERMRSQNIFRWRGRIQTDATERNPNAGMVNARSQALGSNGCDGDNVSLRQSRLQKGNLAFHTVILVSRVDIRARGSRAGNLCICHANFAGVRIKHLPHIIVVKAVEFLDESPIRIVDLPIVQPDSGHVRAVVNMTGAPRTYFKSYRFGIQRDRQAFGLGAVRERAIDDFGIARKSRLIKKGHDAWKRSAAGR